MTVIIRNCTIQLDGVATCSCSTKLLPKGFFPIKNLQTIDTFMLAKYSFPCGDINSEICYCLQENCDVDVGVPSSRLGKSKRLIHGSITCCVTQC